MEIYFACLFETYFPNSSSYLILGFGVYLLRLPQSSLTGLVQQNTPTNHSGKWFWSLLLSLSLFSAKQAFFSPLFSLYWTWGRISGIYHFRLPLVFFPRQLDYAGPIGAPGFVGQRASIWAVWLKWVHCMHGSILSFPMGEAESWDFSSIRCVQNEVGMNQCCLLATMSIVAWIAWLPWTHQSSRTCHTYMHSSGRRLRKTGAVDMWTDPFPPRVELRARVFLSDHMAVLWGRVSGERVSQNSLLLFVSLIFHSLGVCRNLSIGSWFFTKEICS